MAALRSKVSVRGVVGSARTIATTGAALLVFGLPLIVLACGAENPSRTNSVLQPDGSSANTEGGPSQSATTGSTGVLTTPEEALISVPTPTGSAPPNGGECQRDTYEAERTELNLLLLLDLSGSMLAKVDAETGETQWDAVRAAIREFVSSESANDLGISITYYPMLGERTECESGSTCEGGFAYR